MQPCPELGPALTSETTTTTASTATTPSTPPIIHFSRVDRRYTDTARSLCATHRRYPPVLAAANLRWPASSLARVPSRYATLAASLASSVFARQSSTGTYGGRHGAACATIDG